MNTLASSSCQAEGSVLNAFPACLSYGHTRGIHGSPAHRETEVLLDPSSSSVDDWRTIGVVIAHEMAHLVRAS